MSFKKPDMKAYLKKTTNQNLLENHSFNINMIYEDYFD